MATRHDGALITMAGAFAITTSEATEVVRALRDGLAPRLRLRPAPSVATVNVRLAHAVDATLEMALTLDASTLLLWRAAEHGAVGATDGGAEGMSHDPIRTLLAPSVADALLATIAHETPHGLARAQADCGAPSEPPLSPLAAHPAPPPPMLPPPSVPPRLPPPPDATVSGAPAPTMPLHELRVACRVVLEWSIADGLEGPAPPLVFPHLADEMPPRMHPNGAVADVGTQLCGMIKGSILRALGCSPAPYHAISLAYR